MDNKQRILIVHNYYQIPGGEDTVVANESKLLEDNGHKVFKYTRNNLELKEMSFLKKILIPLNTIFNFKTYFDIKKLIKKNNINIVHVHNTLNLISPSVYYAALSCRVPVVQTIHNFRMLCPAATFYRVGKICEDCLKYGLRCSVKHSCYRNSKFQTLALVSLLKFHRLTGIYKKIYYICLTEFNKEKLLQFKQIKNEQIFVKPNFVFNNNNKRDQNNYYLFIGRIDKIKGVDVLLNAFKDLKNKQLLIAGTGNDLEKYISFCKNNNLNNITFLGFKNREELNVLISKSKAVIVAPQWYETFGMVVIEAFSAGVPVIVGDIGNASSLVDDYVTGIKFKYDSPTSLCEAILKFESLNNIDWHKNTIDVFCTKFSANVNYEILNKIYEDCENAKTI